MIGRMGALLSAGILIALSSAAGRTAPAAPVKSPAPLPIDAVQLKRVIAAQHGNVVVLNFWATWCSSCVEEFPDLVRAASADRAKGVHLLTLSFDDPESISGKVVPFLAKNHQTVGSFVNKDGSQLDNAYPLFLEPKLDPAAPVGLPRTYLFDRQGNLKRVLVGPQTYASFQKAIAPLLASKK